MKKNQKTLYEAAAQVSSVQQPLSVLDKSESGHGRQSCWRTSVFDASQHPKSKEWAGLKRFVKVQRSGTRKGKVYTEVSYYISSLEEDRAEVFHAGIRGHWGIENKLHWVKDVVHGEDANGVKKNNGPVNSSVVSTIALNIHRQHGHQSVTLGQIKFASNLKELINIIRT